MSFKAIKMKDHGLNVSKVINKKQITVKKGFQKALWPLFSTFNSGIGEFVVSFFDVTNRILALDFSKQPKDSRFMHDLVQFVCAK